MKKEDIVISVGGSLFVKPEIDTFYLEKFREIILRYLSSKQFFLYVGGGKIARIYQKGLEEFKATNYQKDWIGIWVTRINAKIFKQLFKDYVNPQIIFNPTKKMRLRKPITVAAGWKPGWSTDCDAVLLAKTYGIKKVVNLTNIDYVYDRDPKKYREARAFRKISWQKYRSLITDKWQPGLSTPFDPVASKLAQKFKIKVIILNGTKLDRLDEFLNRGKIIGTIILN